MNQALSHRLENSGKDLRILHDDLAMQLTINRAAHLDTIRRLSLAAEFKDEDTGAHIDRMSQYSAVIGDALGLAESEVENLLYAAPMHDVGKIGIPDNILLKPGKLTNEEHEIMRLHTVYGGQILAGSDSDIIQLAHTIALGHHEKWNGRGYPHGISGEAIPLVARIVNIADLFDALTSKRPYKDPYPVDVALDIIKAEKGTSLDPRMVEVFLDRLDDILILRGQISPEDDRAASEFTWSERDLAAMK